MTTAEIVQRLIEIRASVGPRAREEINDLINDLAPARPPIVGLGTPSGLPLGHGDVAAKLGQVEYVDLTAPPEPPAPRRVVDMNDAERELNRKNRVGAIKALRERVGCGLKEAYDASERALGRVPQL
mgnify:FL=1